MIPGQQHVLTDEKPVFGTVIGIDLGSTYTRVGVYVNGSVEIIANVQSPYVVFTDEGCLVSDTAKNHYSNYPRNNIFDIKRLIDYFFNDKEVQQDIEQFPFKIIDKVDGPAIQVTIKGKEMTFTFEEIFAKILGKMKEIARSYLGKEITKAVVTVPAYFNYDQFKSVRVAGKIAGLDILRIVNEKVATAIAYGYHKSEEEVQILVYDLAGVLLMFLLSSTSDINFGGENFNNRVIDHFVKLYEKKNKVDISQDLKAMDKLKREVEKSKRILSSQMSTCIKIESFHEGKDFSETLTRAQFEELNNDLFLKTIKSVEQVLKDAKIKKKDVHDILLVVSKNINPDEVVVYGNTVYGSFCKEYSFDGVYLGPIDIALLTLGIEVTGGVMAKLISRGIIIPVKMSQNFTTAADNQHSVLIQVYEGEHSITKYNNLLGKFELTGIPPAPRGMPQIEVTFELDNEDILHVSAVDKGTGRSESIVILYYKIRHKGITEEAEQFAEEDKVQIERIGASNQIESFAYTLENQISDESSSLLKSHDDL
ncbi:heat shock protein 70 [Glomus cerebriforme]|uniref:Heat shock protein 70 n=1 Tax=Glomus cerebriforme TaxID=658196 RepID=A0A397SUA8_9GLOM|nr:heat shock protein 70 [Glomus cerebriforme]